MENLTEKQKKRLLQLAEVIDEGTLALFKHFVEMEDALNVALDLLTKTFEPDFTALSLAQAEADSKRNEAQATATALEGEKQERAREAEEANSQITLLTDRAESAEAALNKPPEETNLVVGD